MCNNSDTDDSNNIARFVLRNEDVASRERSCEVYVKKKKVYSCVGLILGYRFLQSFAQSFRSAAAIHISPNFTWSMLKLLYSIEMFRKLIIEPPRNIQRSTLPYSQHQYGLCAVPTILNDVTNRIFCSDDFLWRKFYRD